MTTSPILEGLYQIREQFAARFNYEVAAMVAFLREQQQLEKDHPTVFFSQTREEEEAEKTTTSATQERAA
jgi:hypothetical protein